jgi:NADH-quinone oxidoreductase subunit M
MTASWPILSIVTFLPLVGAAFILLVRGGDAVVARNARMVALWTSLLTFAISLLLWVHFDPANPGFQFVEQREWMTPFGITYHMGVDGISMLFVLLSTLLTPLCILASWDTIEKRVKEFMVAFLVLETMMVGTFAALDLVLFYVFFEAVLIPMFLIIGIWGGGRRVYSAFKFFLYTLAGSVLMLIAILAMYFEAETTDIPTLLAYNFAPSMQKWLWIAFFASFAVKMPMWPVHTWLPDAHVDAPPAGSVILAGVLLKMGGYGFLRFSLPMFPDASAYFTPLVYVLSVVAIIYTSLVALAQEDMKKLIAYSSVAHMGLVTIGCFTPNALGIQGSIVQMLSHGVVSAALFLVVGVVYDRIHSREISRYGGLADRMPVYAVIFLFFTMASIGLPGTSGFIGEIMVIVGVFQMNSWVSALAATGMILGAGYMLWLYRRVAFGTITRDDLKSIKDLRWNEMVAFAPLIFLALWLGIYPSFFTRPMEPAVAQLLQQAQTVDTAAVAGE